MVLLFIGKLFYLDTERSGTGCYCQPEWDVYYYKQTGKCYEQESKGPCPVGQYFAYNATSRSTECSCFKNFVYTPDKGTCIEQYTQGQCPPGQVYYIQMKAIVQFLVLEIIYLCSSFFYSLKLLTFMN